MNKKSIWFLTAALILISTATFAEECKWRDIIGVPQGGNECIRIYLNSKSENKCPTLEITGYRDEETLLCGYDDSWNVNKKVLLDRLGYDTESKHYFFNNFNGNTNKRFQSDKELLLAIIKHYPELFLVANKNLQNNKDFVKSALTIDGTLIKYIIPKFKSDKSLVKVAFNSYWRALRYADIKLRSDKKFVLELMNISYIGFIGAEKKLKNEIKSNEFEELRKNKKVVISAINKHGWRAYYYADQSLKYDKEIQLIAIKRDILSAPLPSMSFRKDKDLQLTFLQELESQKVVDEGENIYRLMDVYQDIKYTPLSPEVVELLKKVDNIPKNTILPLKITNMVQ